MGAVASIIAVASVLVLGGTAIAAKIVHNNNKPKTSPKRPTERPSAGRKHQTKPKDEIPKDEILKDQIMKNDNKQNEIKSLSWTMALTKTNLTIHNTLLQYITEEIFSSCYNIGIVGAQGTGKTSFVAIMKEFIRHTREHKTDFKNINTKMSQHDVDNIVSEAYKAIDKEDVPSVSHDQRHPTPWNLGNMILWDIKGVGADMKDSNTIENDAKSYIENNGLLFMSCVVVTVGTSQNALTYKIIEYLNEFKIPYFVLQTQIDTVIDNDHKVKKRRNEISQKLKPDQIINILNVRRTELSKMLNVPQESIFCINNLPDKDSLYGNDTYEFIQAFLSILKHASDSHGQNNAETEQLDDDDFEYGSYEEINILDHNNDSICLSQSNVPLVDPIP